MPPTACASAFLATALLAAAQEPLSYDTTPLGTPEAPLLLRTYCPDPGLGPEVFAHHHQGARSPKYNPGKGQDVSGEYLPVKGLAAAIAVNHGPALSYVFDTTECRLLYAWQGGFLDMFPYWGSEKDGRRRSFDYVPRLVGTVIHQASGPHPAGEGKPHFLGYELDAKGVPTFRYKIGDASFAERITPLDEPFAFRRTVNGKTSVIRGKELSTHTGFQRDLKIKKATAAAGEDVFMAYGCIACHTTDGGNGHGPTLFNLAGSTRPLADGSSVTADAAYLRESIKDPNAKIAKGFPPNYMPPIPLKDIELEALILFLESLTGE